MQLKKEQSTGSTGLSCYLYLSNKFIATTRSMEKVSKYVCLD